MSEARLSALAVMGRLIRRDLLLALRRRAEIANPDGLLLPGLFATAQVDQGGEQNYLTLPSTAIAYNPYGSTVFIVKDEGKDDKGKPKLTVEQRVVTTGPTRGDQVAVLSGLLRGLGRRLRRRRGLTPEGGQHGVRGDTGLADDDVTRGGHAGESLLCHADERVYAT